MQPRLFFRELRTTKRSRWFNEMSVTLAGDENFLCYSFLPGTLNTTKRLNDNGEFHATAVDLSGELSLRPQNEKE